jgi:fumarate hydratase class II
MSDRVEPAGRARPARARWGKETELAIGNFPVSGRTMPIAIVHALAAIKAEAATVNRELGVAGVDGDTAAAITAAADEVAAGAWDDQFPLDVFQTGSGTSTNMNVNEVIAHLASSADRTVHPNDHVNASQSSNDTFPTAVAIAALLAVRDRLLPALDALHHSLAGVAERTRDVVKAARTHLMDAVPITLGAEFDAYASQVAESRERIVATLPRAGRVPLGGTAVGTGLNAPLDFGRRTIERLHRRTGLDLSVAPDRVAAQGSRDALVELSGQLRGLAVALLKIANDVRWMASGPATGLAEIRLPALQAGSSIMPGKVNPVMAEMLSQVCVQVMGNDAVVALAASQGTFELNTYQPVIAVNLLDAIELLAAAATLFARRCVDGIEADVERNRRHAESSPAIATALNPLLGYERVAQLVEQAIDTRRPLREVVAGSGDLDPATVDRLLDVDSMADPHGPRPSHPGSPPSG